VAEVAEADCQKLICLVDASWRQLHDRIVKSQGLGSAVARLGTDVLSPLEVAERPQHIELVSLSSIGVRR
jgi:hypothetical protein